jgi:hypothetical protein
MPRQRQVRRRPGGITTHDLTADDRGRSKKRDRDRRTVYDRTVHDAQAETATGQRRRLVRERMTTDDMTTFGTQTETGNKIGTETG